ncbi:MAG: TIGR03619 family F420-dependent LLM class oxidoreductase [Acidimicrobiia bacterium]|nr:TIGR03619 family F420-dependent LLM class oxidoreductase [Acidimicrobiia bacterium]
MTSGSPEVPSPQLSAALVTFAERPPADWSSMLDTARLYDRVGIDRLVVSDHVVFGEALDAYARPEVGGQSGGRQPTGPDGHWLEPLTTLSVIAGTTTRVRLATGILIAALRRPVVLAKAAATLDVLSGGRLDLGVGVGWQREEYEAAGLDFDGRGRMLDHTLEVCSALWTQSTAQYRSPELDFERIHMMPKPHQPFGVPIWVSGRINAPVVRRVSRFGRRWIPWGEDATDLERSIPEMRARIAAAGASPDGLQVVANLRVFAMDDGTFDIERTMTQVPPLIAAGATDFLMRPRIRACDAETEAGLRDLVAGFRLAAGRESPPAAD